MTKKITLFGFFCLTTFFALLQSGCKKIPDATVQPEPIVKAANEIPDSFFVKNRKVPGVAAGQENSQNFTNNFAGGGGNTEPSFEDFETPTILGNRLVNPYSIQNMTTAFQLMGSSLTPNVTDLYVRFKPANFAELDVLDDSLDLELQDYPMDYEVLHDGDYYIDPAQTDQEEIPWLYTVVPANFSFPQGIQHQIIEQLHIPEDNLFLEELAESLVAGATYLGGMAGGHRTITRTNLAQPLTVTNQCPCLEPGPEGCAIEWCNPGGIVNPPGSGNFNNPNKARGRITVFDTHIAAGGAAVPVKNVRMIAKRWFKIDKSYTNDNGQFASGRSFLNRVKIKVRFRNNLASVRGIRNRNIWQMAFPVSHRLGVFNRGQVAEYTFARYGNQTNAWFTGWMRKWMAATVHNQLQEHKALAESEFVGTFSSSARLNVLLTNSSLGIKSGAEFRAPMHKQQAMADGLVNAASIEKIVAYAKKGKVGIALAILQLVKIALSTQQPDIVITYRTNLENLSSSEVARNVYGAMTLAALYKETDKAIYKQTFKNIFKITELVIPYTSEKSWADLLGLQDTALLRAAASAITTAVALAPAEKPSYQLYHGYAMYMGNYLASVRYGLNADAVLNQKRETIGPIGMLTSHTRYLEEYNPKEPLDAYRWVPIGLYYDLIDPASGQEAVSGILDNVDQFNNNLLWRAITHPSTPLNLNDFRIRLNSLLPNNTTSTNQLFQQYE